MLSPLLSALSISVLIPRFRLYGLYFASRAFLIVRRYVYTPPRYLPLYVVLRPYADLRHFSIADRSALHVLSAPFAPSVRLYQSQVPRPSVLFRLAVRPAVTLSCCLPFRLFGLDVIGVMLSRNVFVSRVQLYTVR